MSPRGPDELVLRLSHFDYDLTPLRWNPEFVEAVYERVRGALGPEHPSRDCVGRRGNHEQWSLYPEAEFWVVCLWERGRGRTPAFFLSFFDAVGFFLLRTTGSEAYDSADLPDYWIL